MNLQKYFLARRDEIMHDIMMHDVMMHDIRLYYTVACQYHAEKKKTSSHILWQLDATQDET